MSRIGKQPITVPSGVSISVDNGLISVNGPKGNLQQPTLPGMRIESSPDKIVLNRTDTSPENSTRHGLMRSLIQNMVTGVSQGFERKLELNGVGYRVSLQGQELKFNLGFSHEVIYRIPEQVKASVDQNVITISGADKQQVNQVAAEIRALKKPEPYKGKGIRYVGEQIIRKSGKSGKEAA